MTTKREVENSSASAGTTGKSGSKKPYRKPAFRSERVFEQTALACGKVSATQASCKFNRKTS
jgi:hypothetical protein